jgi:hypothetical protein
MIITILGCITKYNVNDIKPYVESIKKCGFKGNKYMLVYEINGETQKYLQDNGWKLIFGELHEHVILQRFRDIYAAIKQNLIEGNTIIWTDVKDVVFQKDPTSWLYDNMDKDILAMSEAVILKDEPWACVNSGTSFPMEWELLTKNQTSYCAGCIIARIDALADLFLEIYRWSKATENKEQLSDQAAYNVLIHLAHFRKSVQFVDQEEGLAVQLGVVFMRPNDTQKKTEPVPKYFDGEFFNQADEKFCIVHQYDRSEIIKNEVRRLYI